MNWLVDAQLPRLLAVLLRQHGHDAVHTRDLPLGNRTSDTEIVAYTEHEARIVMTKDADFVPRGVFRRQPRKLLLIATGNIRNQALEALLLRNLTLLESMFIEHDFIELTAESLIVRTVSGDGTEQTGGTDG